MQARPGCIDAEPTSPRVQFFPDVQTVGVSNPAPALRRRSHKVRDRRRRFRRPYRHRCWYRRRSSPRFHRTRRRQPAPRRARTRRGQGCACSNGARRSRRVPRQVPRERATQAVARANRANPRPRTESIYDAKSPKESCLYEAARACASARGDSRRAAAKLHPERPATRGLPGPAFGRGVEGRSSQSHPAPHRARTTRRTKLRSVDAP